jgi:hypothetical protein
VDYAAIGGASAPATESNGAIRELSGAGLLHRGDGGLITPTRAALHFGELLGS